MRIPVAYEIITEESAQEGDVEERGWLDEEGEEFETVQEAFRYLKDHGPFEPSSSRFHPGIWYTYYGAMDEYGEFENNSFFLKEFTPNEEKLIYDSLKADEWLGPEED